jgi:hypothetical protein
MDKDGYGMIEPELLLSTYQAAKHPDVVSRKISEDAALRDFLNNFDVGTVVEGQVTRYEIINVIFLLYDYPQKSIDIVML